MSNKTHNPLYGCLDHSVVFLGGIASIAADASVTSTGMTGVTISKTGTGQYTFTFTEGYPRLLSVQATLEAATAVDLVPQIASVDLTTAKTVVVKLLAGATATNPSAVCKIHLLVMCTNSTLNP